MGGTDFDVATHGPMVPSGVGRLGVFACDIGSDGKDAATQNEWTKGQHTTL